MFAIEFIYTRFKNILILSCLKNFRMLSFGVWLLCILFENDTILIIITFSGEQESNEISPDSSRNIYVSTTGSLIINKVEAAMKGAYSCEADNGFGTPLKKTISVLVRGKLTEQYMELESC